jgi:hypothetical protein
VYRNVNGIAWGVNMKFALNNSNNVRLDYAGVHGVVEANNAGAERGALILTTATAGALTEKMRIIGNGNVGIGTASPNSKLHVIGDGKLTGNLAVDGNIQLTLSTAGNIQLCRNASNQIATCSSSLRYKTNIVPFSPGLDIVQRLHPIRFAWKDGGMKDLGFGAEDVAKVEPLLVTHNDSGGVEGVKDDRISAVLVNAVQEQQAQIETQKSQLRQQQLQIEARQKQLTRQEVLIDGLRRLLCSQDASADVCH